MTSHGDPQPPRRPVAKMHGDLGRRPPFGEEGLAERLRDGEVRTVPAYSDDDPKAAMGAMVGDGYGDPARGAVPEWPNRFAVMSWPEWLTFDALTPAARIAVPALMVHSEEAAFPGNARRLGDALGGPHEIVWREGTQIDFYHAPAQVRPAVADHMRRTLGAARLRGMTMDTPMMPDQVRSPALIAAMTALVDLRDWERLTACFADRLTLDYTSLWGGSAQEVSRTDLLAQWRAMLPGFDATCHELGPLDVTVRGGKATAEAPARGTHLLDGEAWVVAGR